MAGSLNQRLTPLASPQCEQYTLSRLGLPAGILARLLAKKPCGLGSLAQAAPQSCHSSCLNL
jgi:hypothetical protein